MTRRTDARLAAIRRRQAQDAALVRRAAEDLGVRLGELTPDQHAHVLRWAARLRELEQERAR